MKKIDRRLFMKSMGMTGIGSLLAITGTRKTHATNKNIIPTRPFGKTGVNISILGLGGSQDLTSKQLLLRQAVKMGITYWDTAHSYGNSEASMGKYFEKYPGDRKKVFLVTKSNSSDPKELTDSLNTSLERLQTDYVNMFFVHGVSNAQNELTPSVKKWAASEKRKGRIRLFGFSTHKNMEKCLAVAAKLGWVDGIMTSYNYRLMNTDAMKESIDQCASAGIGLVAMKTQAPMLAKFWADIGKEENTSRNLTDRFMNKGFTVEQAKLKVVWEDSRIAGICSEMPNMTILKANAAAAINKTKLTDTEKTLFNIHARKTAAVYCSGCAECCETVLSEDICISDAIRCVMYAHEYGETERARHLLRQIPSDTLSQLTAVDYSAAESVCPNKMPIAALMKEAARLLV